MLSLSVCTVDACNLKAVDERVTAPRPRFGGGDVLMGLFEHRTLLVVKTCNVEGIVGAWGFCNDTGDDTCTNVGVDLGVCTNDDIEAGDGICALGDVG